MSAVICEPAVAGFGMTGGSSPGQGTPVSASPDHFLLGKRSSGEHSCLCFVSVVGFVVGSGGVVRSPQNSFSASPRASGRSFSFNNCLQSWSERIQSGEERLLSPGDSRWLRSCSLTGSSRLLLGGMFPLVGLTLRSVSV